jgi:hypothetical protein
MNDGLKDLFKQVLGSDVNIKDNINPSEKSFFCLMVNKLDQTHIKDEKLFELSGIDLTKMQNDLWLVIESLLKLTYGTYAFDMIMWYIFDRFNPDGTIVPFVDDKNNSTTIKSPKELYDFIKHRFPAE